MKSLIRKKLLFILVRPFYSEKGWVINKSHRKKWGIGSEINLVSNYTEADVILLPYPINYYIINGLSDYSHPCQILSDLLTIEETIGEIKNKFICWVGDFNNVLRSLIHLQKIY